jgi:hypothetical protein
MNQAPTANAGAPQTVLIKSSVTLNGSASSDPEGQALTYGWSQVAGTPVALTNSTSPSPTFTAPGSAMTTTLTFQLVVTDSLGLASAPAQVVITVKSYPVMVPLVVK